MPACLRYLIALLLVSLSPFAVSATLLVVNKSEASVSLHDLPGGQELLRLPTGEAPHEVAVSPDGTTAVVTNYGTREAAGRTLTVVDIPRALVTGTITLPPGSRPHGVEWLDQRRVVVTAEGIRTLLVVDVAAAEVEASMAIDQDVAHMVAASPALQRAFVANIGSGTASAVDLRSARKLADLESGEGSEGIALAGSGGELWVTNRAAGTVSVFSTGSLERLAQIPLPGFPIRAEADDPRGRVYVTLASDDALSVVDIASRREAERVEFSIAPDTSRKTVFGDSLPDSSIPVGVLLAGDGKTLFVAHSSAHLISVWNPDTLQQIATIATGLEPDGMAWSPLKVDRR